MTTPHHLLTVDDLPHGALPDLFTQAAFFKQTRRSADAQTALAGRVVALLFEKPSLRTRVSFEVATRELGGSSLYLSPQEVGLGQREAVRDVARVLSSYASAIVIRTFRHAVIEEFAAASSAPVINALTDEHHPCQGLTDVFTIAENFGGLSAIQGMSLAYLGDGNNVAHSLIQAAALAGMRVRVATPAGYEPDPAVIEKARAEARATGGEITLLNDPAEAALGASVVYTDVWVSMGQEAEAGKRLNAFTGYQVNEALLAHAAPDAIVMHPLPAKRGIEVTDSVLDGPQSRVFIQAENRLHVQKALLHSLLAGAR